MERLAAIKKATLLLVLVFCGLSCNQSQKSTGKKIQLRIKGSDTMYPLTKLLCTSFQLQNSNYSILLEGGGTTAAVKDFLENKVDIVSASRELKIGEKASLDSVKKEFLTYPVAYDGVAVIVNAQNKITQISREQLADIYQGKITNWKELGGERQKIEVYALQGNSSTDEFFRDRIMGEKKYASLVKRVARQKEIIKKVSSNPAAIGYCNLQEVTTKLLALSVSFDSSKTFIAPTEFNFQNNAYPISRAFYFYAARSKEAEMKLFMDYTKSLLGRRNISEMGFIPAQ